MQVNLTLPTQATLLNDANIQLDAAKAFTVDSQEMYALAARELQEIKGRAKTLDERRKAITKPLDEAKAAVMELFRAPLGMLADAEKVLKVSLGAWDQEQERLRREEEERLREIARKERERLQAEARKAEEAARKKAEELQRKAAAEAAAGNAAKAAALAEKAARVVDDAGEKATALQQQASIVVAPTVLRDAPKVSGISMRTLWRARVVDVALVPREWLVTNDTALNKFAESTKGAIKIPGVEIYSEQSIASSARR